MRIILGSGSPRRKELLQSIWFGDIEIVKSTKEEIYPAELPLSEVPEFLAVMKADDLSHYLKAPHDILVTADTIVILNDNILGKPIDQEDAKSMLRALSGNAHRVVTGVVMRSLNLELRFSETTLVTFGTLSNSDIDFYIEKYDPLDKAGAYGIQEYIGMVGVEKIEGCFYNVMGLPVSRLFKQLQEFR